MCLLMCVCCVRIKSFENVYCPLFWHVFCIQKRTASKSSWAEVWIKRGETKRRNCVWDPTMTFCLTFNFDSVFIRIKFDISYSFCALALAIFRVQNCPIPKWTSKDEKLFNAVQRRAFSLRMGQKRTESEEKTKQILKPKCKRVETCCADGF